MVKFIFLTLLLSFVSSKTFAFIYDGIDLHNPSEVSSSHPLQEYRRSVATMVRGERIQRQSGGFYFSEGIKEFIQHKFSPKDRVQGEFCRDKYPFQNEALLGFCTATLVGPRHLITAGHCVVGGGTKLFNENCENYPAKFLFDFDHTLSLNSQVPEKSIYSCSRIIFASTPQKNVSLSQEVDHNDIALIELDREVTGRTIVPMDLNISGHFRDLKEIVSIAYPLGLPQKFVLNGHVESPTKRPHDYSIMIDNLKGSSGAPLFDLKTGSLIGVTTVGAAPFYVHNGQCIELYQCPTDRSPCRSSYMTSLEAIKSYLGKFENLSLRKTETQEKWSTFYEEDYLKLVKEKNNILLDQQKTLSSWVLNTLNLNQFKNQSGVVELKTTPSSLKMKLYQSKLSLLDSNTTGSSEAFHSWAKDAVKINSETLFYLLEEDRFETSQDLSEVIEEGLKIFFTQEFMNQNEFKIQNNKFLSFDQNSLELLKKLFHRVKFLQGLGGGFEYILTHQEEEWSELKESDAFIKINKTLERFWSSEITEKALKGVSYTLTACGPYGDKLRRLNKVLAYEKHEDRLWQQIKNSPHGKNLPILVELKKYCEETFESVLK